MFCLDKIHSTLESNDFWRNVSKNGVRLEQVIGYEILEKDVDFWDEQTFADFRRNNYVKKSNLTYALKWVYGDTFNSLRDLNLGKLSLIVFLYLEILLTPFT